MWQRQAMTLHAMNIAKFFWNRFQGSALEKNDFLDIHVKGFKFSSQPIKNCTVEAGLSFSSYFFLRKRRNCKVKIRKDSCRFIS